MRSLISTSAIAAVAAFALAPSTAMAVPFDSNPVVGGLASGASSDGNVGTFSADDFVLAVDSKITGVVWYGNVTDLDDDGVAIPDDFAVSFFTDDAGFPALAPITEFFGGDLTVSTSATGLVDASGQDIIEYSASIDGPDLLAGATYWLAVENLLEDLGGTTQGDEWVWAVSSTAGTYFIDNGVTANIQGDNNLAFSLSGDVTTTVSEPAALSLLGFGLMGVALVGRRRR